MDAEFSEMALGLIGAPAFADGREVGKLVDFSIGEDGRIDKIRVSQAGMWSRNLCTSFGRGATCLSATLQVKVGPDLRNFIGHRSGGHGCSSVGSMPQRAGHGFIGAVGPAGAHVGVR